MAVVVDELALLERVFLRIGSAESDEQLQNAISKFLPPVLLKLSSTQDGVRKKVMELLVHINKRIKSRPLVQLPVDALLVQYQDPAASSFVINFTIIYIKLGYPRLLPERQAALVPTVLTALEGKPESHQDSLVLLLMPVLGQMVFPPEPKKRVALLGLNEKPHLAKMLAEFMLDMLLLPYGALIPQPDPTGAAAAVATPPGMSDYGFKRVSGDIPLKADDIEQIKLGIVRFLSRGVMADSSILIHLIVAVADTRFAVANAADIGIKKVVGGLDWTSAALVAPLLHLFLGTTTLRSNSRATPKSRRGKEEFRRRPANTRIRLKIMPYLLRARGAAIFFPDFIQVVFECLFGAVTNPRLRTMGLQLAMVVIDNSSSERLNAVGGVMGGGLLRLISDKDEDRDLKKLAYLAIGKLGHKIPVQVNSDMSLLDLFFQALHEESPETRMAVREALLSMTDAFKLGPEDADQSGEVSAAAEQPASQSASSIEKQDSEDSAESKDKRARTKPISRAELRAQLLTLLARQVESEEPMARFVAVRYLSVVFAPIDEQARYLLLLATGDEKDEVFTEALKALYGLERRAGRAPSEDAPATLALPAFQRMVIIVSTRAEERAHDKEKMCKVGTQMLPFKANTYTEILNYLRLCLSRSAGVASLTPGPAPHASTPLIGRYLSSLPHLPSVRISSTVSKYLVLALGLLGAQAGPGVLEVVIELAGAAPQCLEPAREQMLICVKNLLSVARDELRELAAQLYGITLSHGASDAELEAALAALATTVGTGSGGKHLEAQHGALLALAHCVERRAALGKTVPGLKSAVDKIVSMVTQSNVLLSSAACVGVGLVGGRLALPLSSDEKSALVEQLLAVVDDAKANSKARERAARSVGSLCLGEEFPHAGKIIDSFLTGAKETRDIEVHFTVGDALVMCALGPRHPAARDAFTTLEEEHAPAPGQDHVQYVVDKLITEYAPLPHPNTRQAVCCWLLALLKQCPRHAAITANLSAMQRVFMELISDDSDIVQDVASKGLALVYEASDETLRATLVAALLDQLTSGRRSVAQVTGETKLFEEGALGKAPAGGNLSTYKELCSLASDLNQPDLIYKFMHLANHNAIWNSKKGAAFGFSSIAANAKEQLAEYLPKIVPRLYRYTFDPTPRIQASMSSIWHSLVLEHNKTIELYRVEILDDLLANLTAPQWRVRISCCLALSDLLRGPSGSAVLRDGTARLPELWRQLFRVMDDVHEGTRVAAGNTARVLAKMCVRSCDASNGKAGDEMMALLLPVLLDTGITNTVAEVRQVSLQCMSQLVTSAGTQLRPHLAQLIPALLEATGELESSKLSQLSAMHSADQDTQSAIDNARANIAKHHHTTETVTKCLQYVDESVLEGLMPRVMELMKSSVGLGTKVACAHLIALLVTQLRLDMQPYAGKLLASLVAGLSDRNVAVRKNYASAIGQVASVAKDASVEKLLTKLRRWYMEKEEEQARATCAITLAAIGARSQDLLKNNAEIVAPLAFFAMHEEKTTDTSTAEAWQEVWGEVSTGMESGIRTHSTDICQLLADALDSPSWTMKAQAAAAVSTVATKAGATLATEHRDRLLTVLVAGLTGRTWSGKEKLLSALATLVENSKESLTAQAELSDTLAECLLREANKEQPAYKIHALRALGDVLSALQLDRFDRVHDIAQAALDKSAEAGTSDESDRGSEREVRLQLKEVVYETLGKTWPTNTQTQVRHRESLLAQCTACLASSTRPVQVAVVAALRRYIDKLQLLAVAPEQAMQEDEEALDRILTSVYQALTLALAIPKHGSLRKESLAVVYLVATKLKDSGRTEQLSRLASAFHQPLVEVASDQTPEIKSKVSDIKELLKT